MKTLNKHTFLCILKKILSWSSCKIHLFRSVFFAHFYLNYLRLGIFFFNPWKHKSHGFCKSSDDCVLPVTPPGDLPNTSSLSWQHQPGSCETRLIRRLLVSLRLHLLAQEQTSAQQGRATRVWTNLLVKKANHRHVIDSRVLRWCTDLTLCRCCLQTSLSGVTAGTGAPSSLVSGSRDTGRRWPSTTACPVSTPPFASRAATPPLPSG